MFRRITFAAALAVTALFAVPALSSASVVFDDIPTPLPGNLPSQPFQAGQVAELGGQAGLAGSDRSNPAVTVTMSSWGCQSGTWNGLDCSTTTGATFSHPITLTLYNVGPGNAVGSPIASMTDTFNIPFRPSADNTNCTGANAGKWFDGTQCNNGLANNITFDFAGQGVLLPSQVIAAVSFNTTSWGAAPIGTGAACFSTPQGCGYDSLNVALNTIGGPDVGTLPAPDDAYLNSQTAAQYCDGGAGGTGTFRLDPGAGCWTGFQPAFSIAATPGFTVNDNTTGPGPAGADCANPDYSTISAAVAAVPAGSTILVCAGTYPETVNVNKQLTIKGAQAGVDARTRAVPAASESSVTTGGFGVVADGVTIDGFTVQNVGASPVGTGISLAGANSGQRVVNNIVKDNIFGMYVNNAPDHQTVVRHNLIDNNNAAGAASGNGIYGDAGIENVVIDQNKITNQSTNAGILLTEVPSTEVRDVRISGNELVGNRIRITEGQDMTITGNTITNSSSNGVQLDSASRNVDITNNTVTGSGLGGVRFSAFDYPADGPSENVTVTGNTLTGGDYGVLVNDQGGDPAYNGQLEVHFNRIADNATNGLALNDNADVNAANNWWGCNAGPGSAGCDTVGGDFAGQVDSGPWLLMLLTASPSTVYQTTGQSQLTANFTVNSNAAIAGSGFPDGTPVGFTTDLGAVTTPGVTDGGRAGGIFMAGATLGTATIHAVLDGETASGASLTTVQIVQGPTGPAGQTGATGTPGANGAVGGVTQTKCKKGKKLNKKGKCVKKKRKKKK